MYPFITIAALLQAGTASHSLISDCSQPSSVIAAVTDSDAVQVHSAFSDGAEACYSVTAVVNGARVNGYVLGSRLPAIVAFERARRAAQPIGLPAPPAAPASEQAAKSPPAPLERFADFSALDVTGKPFSLRRLTGKVTVICFWSPGRRSRAELDTIRALYDEYHQHGLDAVGVVLDPDRERILGYLDESGIDFAQIPNGTGLARKYNLSGNSLPATFVLNSQHEIVTTKLHDKDLSAAVRSLLSR